MGKTAKPDVTAALNYLHDAYDVGVDQLRVIDEIVRITAAAGRIPDCLTALEIRAEILEMQAENATQQRKQLLNDQIVGIRRWQANLARERVGNLELAWQYLEKSAGKVTGGPAAGARASDRRRCARSAGTIDSAAGTRAGAAHPATRGRTAASGGMASTSAGTARNGQRRGKPTASRPKSPRWHRAIFCSRCCVVVGRCETTTCRAWRPSLSQKLSAPRKASSAKTASSSAIRFGRSMR